MAQRDVSAASGSIDQVMNQVLLAERDARAAVQRCQAQADAILADAEERARRISRHAERRIKTVSRIADGAVEQVLRELRRGDRKAAGQDRGGWDDTALERALDALVDEIIGGGS